MEKLRSRCTVDFKIPIFVSYREAIRVNTCKITYSTGNISGKHTLQNFLFTWFFLENYIIVTLYT